MQKPEHRVYRFDPFTLDLTRGCLLRDGTELKLRPKSYEVLKYLAENSGRLVSKDEIISSVWLETAVTDDSLVQCLKDIRHALADDHQQIIRTVPRRGYIFEKDVIEEFGTVLPIETAAGDEIVDEAPSAGPHAKAAMSGRRRALISVAALVLLAGTAAFMFRKPVLAWFFKPPSIAVLPVINATGDGGLDYISDGITESIITSLTQLNEKGRPRLRVISQNTAFIFKGKELEPRSIGLQLGVDTILTGKMLRQPDDSQVFKVELVNVSDGSIMWLKQYASHILIAQNEIAKDVAEQLPLTIGAHDIENLTRRYTQNAEAYDLYLKGRAACLVQTPSGIANSIGYYQRAIEVDPNFALAYWAIGFSFWMEGASDMRADIDANELAASSYQRALNLDANLTVAAEMLKMVQTSSWNWEAAAKEGPTNFGYGAYLIAMGRAEEQAAIEDRRLTVDPLHPVLNYGHCTTLFQARRYDDAIAQCQKTLNLVPGPTRAYFGPESPAVHRILANVYTQKGMFAEAIAEAQTAVTTSENSTVSLALLASIYARAGQTNEAGKIIDILEERMDKGEYAPPLNIAFIFANLGDNDKAFYWLNRAFDERESRLGNMKSSPNFDPLRSDPRFAELMKRVGLPV